MASSAAAIGASGRACSEKNAAQMLKDGLARNRELVIQLYLMRNENPPNQSSCAKCLLEHEHIALLLQQEEAAIAHLSPTRDSTCSDAHSVMGEVPEFERPPAWEVYANMPGVDNLFSGLSKRTPSGGYFTS